MNREQTAILTNNQPPLVDGVGDYSFILGTQLQEKGSPNVIICKKNKDVLMSDTCLPFIKSWLSVRSCLKLIEELKRRGIRKMVWMYVPYSFQRMGMPYNLIAWYLFIRLSGIKLITHFHEVKIYNTPNAKARFIRFNQGIIARLLNGLSDKSIVSTDLFSSYFPYSRKVIKIPIPSNMHKVGDRTEPHKYDVAFFGAYALGNIKTFLQQINFELKVIFVGKYSSEIRTELEEIISQNVYVTGVFTGIISVEEISRYLSQSAIGVMLGTGGISSKSGTIAAFYQHGLVVVGFNGHLTDEDMFRQNENIVFVKSVTDSVAIINRLLSDPIHLKRMQQRSDQFYKDKISWEVVLQSYLKVLD